MSANDPKRRFNSETAEDTPQHPRRRRRSCWSRRDCPLGPYGGRGLWGHRGRRWRRTGIPARNDSRDRRRRASLAVLLRNKSLLRPSLVGCDRAQRILGGLESLHNRLGVARGSRKSGLEVHAHELDAGRRAERNRRLAGKGDLEEIPNHRSRDIATRLAMSHGRGIVETHISADDEVGRKADEPAILLVIGGAGLARDGPFQNLELLGSAALDYAFHDRNHLIGAHRINDLRAVVDELRLLLA